MLFARLHIIKGCRIFSLFFGFENSSFGFETAGIRFRQLFLTSNQKFHVKCCLKNFLDEKDKTDAKAKHLQDELDRLINELNAV